MFHCRSPPIWFLSNVKTDYRASSKPLLNSSENICTYHIHWKYLEFLSGSYRTLNPLIFNIKLLGGELKNECFIHPGVSRQWRMQNESKSSIISQVCNPNHWISNKIMKQQTNEQTTTTTKSSFEIWSLIFNFCIAIVLLYRLVNGI